MGGLGEKDGGTTEGLWVSRGGGGTCLGGRRIVVGSGGGRAGGSMPRRRDILGGGRTLIGELGAGVEGGEGWWGALGGGGGLGILCKRVEGGEGRGGHSCSTEGVEKCGGPRYILL